MKKYLFIKPAQFVFCSISIVLTAVLELGMGFVDGAFVDLALDASMDRLALVFTYLWSGSCAICPSALCAAFYATGIHGASSPRFARTSSGRSWVKAFRRSTPETALLT